MIFIIIYIYVCSYNVLIIIYIYIYTYCTILPNKSNPKKVLMINFMNEDETILPILSSITLSEHCIYGEIQQQ